MHTSEIEERLDGILLPRKAGSPQRAPSVLSPDVHAGAHLLRQNPDDLRRPSRRGLGQRRIALRRHDSVDVDGSPLGELGEFGEGGPEDGCVGVVARLENQLGVLGGLGCDAATLAVCGGLAFRGIRQGLCRRRLRRLNETGQMSILLALGLHSPMCARKRK
jgi:hypothetical protein